MLSQRLILLYLIILFTGNLAQQGIGDTGNQKLEEDDDDGIAQPEGQNRVPPVNPQRAPSQLNPPTALPPSSPRPSLEVRPLNAPASGSGRRAPAPPTPLGTSSECRLDVQKYCAKGSTKPISNLRVLQCIDDLDNAVNLINIDCQHLIYSFKYNMTHDPRFDDAAQKQCAKDIKLFDECENLMGAPGSGRLVSCLSDFLPNITEPTCRYFINQMQAIVFGDWRLSEYFADSCMSDITRLECGRLDDENKAIPHEQGAVIACLSQKYHELGASCRKQIVRLAEMQSDDYHLDRALYYACRDDRDRLCHQVSSGNGRVYRCLYDQKFNAMMSEACRKEVHRRQSLVVADVRMDAPLIRACRSEMREHSCSIDPDETNQSSSLVRLLLCLEEILKRGRHIQDECRREMLVHRRMLMSDYALLPELQKECKFEMVKYCPSLLQQGVSGTIDQRGGRMIHCLLSAARKDRKFNTQCLSVVNSLMRAADPGSDIRADPLLESACRPVITTLCPRMKSGDSNIILCLLDNLKHTQMTEECEDRLMEVAYFMARDWRLTPRLLRTCQDDLDRLCHLPSDWSMKKDINDVQLGMYLGCLYQQRKQLKRECQSELKRIMHIRTQSIGLMPEIEENCIGDLATCKNPEVKGEEFKCLQKKYNKLEDSCRDAVRNYTQMTMSDPTLDFLLMKACEPMIQAYCSNVEDGNENDLIRCLIRHKNEPKMDPRCKAGIDHHQITSMKDEAFLSDQFRRKCTDEIKEHCTGKKTKAAVIQCLADLMLRDVLKKENKITPECRVELKFELLQRSESIDFDPTLNKACRSDIKRFCKDRTPGNAQILDCLKENHARVSAQCYDKLRKREKLDVISPENDYSLMSKCAPVIQKFCSNENKQNILSCLRRNSNQDAMSNVCRRILMHRLMVLNSDVRFNKALIDSCQSDINKHCKAEVIDSEKDDKDSDEDSVDDNNQDGEDDNPTDDSVTDREMGGRIIECLRSKYVDTGFTLESQCVTELVDVIQASKLDVKLDVKLYQHCRKLLDQECTGMDQEDCLKIHYQHNEIRDEACKAQVRRIIQEGKADIHVDRALAFACQADVTKYCNDIPIGSGKQLDCLLSMIKSVTNQCHNMLRKRQELWASVSDIQGVGELWGQVQKSNNSLYLFTVIALVLFVIFMAGCICRPYVRYSRVRKYK